jgi:hypothetical protein
MSDLPTIRQEIVQAQADGPEAAKRFQRIERAARRDFDQRFWWRPRRRVPERAPNL